jgi:hypothetical protein
MPKTGGDQFANQAIVSVLESAANTLTFKKLETGISIADKVAWILSRIEYFVSGMDAADFNGDADTLEFGLSVSAAFTTAALTETSVLDYNNVARRDIGTAASGFFLYLPWVKDFSSLPGGGILVPPVPLYVFAKGTGLANAKTVVARLWYTNLSMTVDQYWELVEARRIISS